jgi:hypothetical protein
VTENAADTSTFLPLEEVAQAVRELGSESTLEGFAARFLERVRRWAAPSAVLAAVRDPGAESGWRLLPALCAGSGPLGAERSVRQLVDELPQDLATARLVRPGPQIPGAKMRANCVVPWTCEGESGVLVLRGVPGSSPANLTDAIALLCAPVWPRVLGGPAERVESSVVELRRLADRLREDADRQVERLQAARTPEAPAPPGPPADAGRVAELEQQLAAARAEVDRLTPASARVGELEQQLSTARTEVDRLSPLSGRVPELEQQLSTARTEVDRLSPLSGRMPELEQQLSAARAEIDRLSPLSGRVPELEQQLSAARAEVDALSTLVQSLRSESASRLEGQRAAVDARAEARAAKEGLAEAREVEARLKAMVEQLQSEKATAAWRREEERTAEEKQAEASRASLKASEEGLEAARRELANAEASVARLIVEREELRQQVTTLEKALVEAEEERDEFHDETTRLESRLHALGIAQPAAASEGAAGGTAQPAPWTAESMEALRRALAVMRRTPYLPPLMRVAAQEAEAAAGTGAEAKERWARVVILDRDTAALESLAGQLESAGLDVKIASHPEELALLLKTPEGREVDAAICDVVAFRPDQNVAGIFRGWEKDRPGLALYLTFARDSTAEVERAQRVPLSLTKGRFQRPLNWTEVMEMLEPLRRTAS